MEGRPAILKWFDLGVVGVTENLCEAGLQPAPPHFQVGPELEPTRLYNDVPPPNLRSYYTPRTWG